MMIGDVVGDPGLEVLEKRLPALIAENASTLTVVNGENAAAGFGLSEESLNRIFAAGADVVTSGNHVWEKRDFWPVLESERPVLRPANYPEKFGTQPGEVPGKGWLCLEKQGARFLVINLQGREKMTPIDCPFRCADNILAKSRDGSDGAGDSAAVPAFVVVDFHAESSAEKEALAYYLDGRASLVAGTHTHVQTADERILPGGTAYITDLGMTGAMNGVIGMDPSICINRARTQIAYRMECALPESEEDSAIQGIIAEFDGNSKNAV
ncbi:MAG: YmdB family metallophosphoesterase, partial [Spirochaetales bacterium]|nr:YmdB family metallophosphoesterase [Spirochaetales bacterium]